jgi:APA family basic amino acid/polyamine antiporter
MARPQFGLWSGIGLVVANTVGVGVLTTTGYMAGRLGPGAILLAWLVGGGMAIAGARCYAELARAIPSSGGEYRYLSDLLHPFLGTVAGWTSLLVGFSAPVALAAATAGPFFATLVPAVPPQATAVALIVLAAISQAFDQRWSKGVQDVLALIKVLLIGGFIVVGVVLGSHAAPTWQAPQAIGESPVHPFAVSLVYITFAFSGWNAVAYAAQEFRDPERTVPRAIWLGTALVTLTYVAVNAIFVANLSGERLTGWLQEDTSRITLAHLLITKLVGPAGGRAASLFVVILLGSSVISMTLVGPRVAAVMAEEGYLPRVFIARANRPPVWSVLIQGGIALVLLLTHGFEALLRSVGAVLTLSSAVTVAAVVRLRFGTGPWRRPPATVLGAALLYVGLSAWILWFTISEAPRTLLWLTVVIVAAVVGYVSAASNRSAAGRARRRPEPAPNDSPVEIQRS